MGASAGSFNGALPGLTLKAWAQIALNGTLIRSSNVASVAKGAAGLYTLTFTSALATTTYIVRATLYPKDGTHTVGAQEIQQNGANTTGAAAYTTYIAGAATDVQHFVEVYE